MFLNPYTLTYPKFFKEVPQDPPESAEEYHIPEIAEEYYEPPSTTEYNLPSISYQDQEVPKAIILPSYKEIEHGYEYGDPDDTSSWY